MKNTWTFLSDRTHDVMVKGRRSATADISEVKVVIETVTQ